MTVSPSLTVPHEPDLVVLTVMVSGVECAGCTPFLTVVPGLTGSLFGLVEMICFSDQLFGWLGRFLFSHQL